MKRWMRLSGCALAWLVTAVLGAAEAVLTSVCLDQGRYAAENMRAEETASVALTCAVFLLPVLLMALCGAVWLTMCCRNRGDSGQRPGERDRGEEYADDIL
ncbi:hypothetical protein [uncultured Dysosmobacter sp.]|uniref:hypothetical protein n=1 Tax=uncultured Dysosmobacter sp. TaxID=2591384 RepID=UPI00260D8278|nr:hypothetical protein [uncultured Dysosmobacter sp.]